MKPKYIFSAVFLICVLMIAVLPQIARPAAAAGPTAVQAASASTAANISASAGKAAAAQPAHQQPAPTLQPTLPPLVLQPPAQSAPPAPSKQGSLPSPADPSASSGQGLASIPATSSLPDLASFAASVRNGPASLLTGVYVPGQFAMPVVQQPAGDTNYVDSSEHTITEYARSASYDVTGLLAHNTQNSGQEF